MGSVPAVGQRLAFPAVLLVVLVDGHEDLLLYDLVLHHGHGNVLHYWVWHVLVDWHLLDDLNLLDDGDMHRHSHLVVVVDRVDLVWYVDLHVLVAVAPTAGGGGGDGGRGQEGDESEFGVHLASWLD